MKTLQRIAIALERIAAALEKQDSGCVDSEKVAKKVFEKMKLSGNR